MTEREQWAQLIRRWNLTRIWGMERRLFVDPVESIYFLLGLMDVRYAPSPPKRVIDLVTSIRRRFLELSQSQAKAFIEAADGSRFGTDVLRELTLLLFGRTTAEVGDSARMIALLLDGAEEDRLVGDVDHFRFGSSLFCLITLANLGPRGVTHTWRHAFREIFESSNSSLLGRLFRSFTFSGADLGFTSFSSWGADDSVFMMDGGRLIHVQMPVPDEFLTWVQDQHVEYRRANVERSRPFLRLLRDFQNRIDDFRSTYERRWLEMLTEPRWSLREGWIGCCQD